MLLLPSCTRPTPWRTAAAKALLWSTCLAWLLVAPLPPNAAAGVDQAELRITEIMYHPPDADGVDGTDLEFIELKNVGTTAADLTGIHFSAGIQFAFADGTSLEAGAILVLASAVDSFHDRYGFAPYAEYSGALANTGERVTLSGADQTPVFTVAYDDAAPWPTAADGGGFSLVLLDPSAPAGDADRPTAWRRSTQEGGSPGSDDPQPAPTPPVVINEILTHTDPPQLDSVELVNPTALPADIGGWYLTDRLDEPRQFRIPDGTLLPPGGYAVYDSTHFGFGLSEMGEQIGLFAADAAGQLSGYSHGFAFGAAANGVSFGRYIDSSGREQFPAQRALTLGTANAGPALGPVVFSAVLADPAQVEDEFIELTNVLDQPTPLYDPNYPQNGWRLEGVGSLTLPAGLVLPAYGLLYVTPLTPEEFRSRHALPPDALVIGPYDGELNDGGQTLRLLRPNTPNTDGSVPYLVVDALTYDDQPPWPPIAGRLLQRTALTAHGDDPANWHVGELRQVFLPAVTR